MTADPAAAPPETGAFDRPCDETESALAAAIDRLVEPPSLRDAVAYAALGGGKRVRPLLAWHAAAAVGPDGDADRLGRAALPAAVAIELVHGFSLVHDDLPAMDDDDLRRGRPTLHVHAGEAMAVLAGDAMLNAAYAALGEVGDPALAGVLTRELAAGTGGMIAGQVLDTLRLDDRELSDEQRLRRIHRNKTGALIVSACRLGAFCGLAELGRAPDPADPAVAALSAYGEAIGLMFQVVDDLIDVEQPAEAAGKRTGKDAEAGKLTFPGVLGVAASRAEVARLERAAEAALRPFADRAEPLRAVISKLASRTT